MKLETKFSYCTLCDCWILLGNHRAITDPVTTSHSYIVMEETPRGQIAHNILSGKRLAQKKRFEPPPDIGPEAEAIWVHPKPTEPEVIQSPETELLAIPPEHAPPPKWTADEQEFYEVQIISHNAVGMTGKLSNEERVFIHNHVAKNTDYPPGSMLWVRLKPSGPNAMTSYRAVELWRETEQLSSAASELEPVGATLADIFKEKL